MATIWRRVATRPVFWHRDSSCLCSQKTDKISHQYMHKYHINICINVTSVYTNNIINNRSRHRGVARHVHGCSSCAHGCSSYATVHTTIGGDVTILHIKNNITNVYMFHIHQAMYRTSGCWGLAHRQHSF